jgi:hypothetical protein
MKITAMKIVTTGTPLGWQGPSLPFRWLIGLEVRARKEQNKAVVCIKKIADAIKEKGAPAIADYWLKSGIQKLTFDSYVEKA